ncbi:MAG: hypothetical protein P4M15_04030 [Alphaproteobacteria bacterium]|nr:hypothetical protein [Alphaproteobacteria bacterium]
MPDFIKRLYAHYFAKPSHQDEQVRADQDMQAHKTEADIDEALKESFPASDPPAH